MLSFDKKMHVCLQHMLDKRRAISCIVLVCNEADRIEQCLAPLSGWVDQLLVLDSGSQDNTVELARKYTDEVIETDWPGYGPQRNRALALCRHDWVLTIDADEVVTESLKQEVDKVLREENLKDNFLCFPWATYLFGKPLKYGRYSSPQGKLFEKKGVKFKDRQVHETLIMPDMRKRVLKSRLIHHSWRDYLHMQDKHLKYAVLGAQDKAAKGKKSSIAYAVLRFFSDFLQQYILRLGVLDGWRGLLMALVLAQYAFHKYAALTTINQQQSADN